MHLAVYDTQSQFFDKITSWQIVPRYSDSSVTNFSEKLFHSFRFRYISSFHDNACALRSPVIKDWIYSPRVLLLP